MSQGHASSRLAVALDDLPWQHQAGVFRGLGFDFTVRTLDAGLGRYLDKALSPLASGSGPPGRTYSVVSGPALDPQRRHHLYLDSQRVGRPVSTRDTISLLLWSVNREAVRSVPDHLVVHAAAAEFRGQAILFPAAMEAGKTTLVAGLVRAGLRYLTDEAAAIEPRTGRILPYPKSLSVERGSWLVLPELEPEPDPVLADHLPPQWQVDPRAIRADAIAPGGDIKMVIAPQYQPGGVTALEPMGRAEAVVSLMQNCFNLADHRSQGLEAFAGLVRGCRCYRLSVADLNTACRLVLGALETTTR